MALQTSGPISMNEAHIEAGGTSGTTVSMNDSDMRALAGVPSGSISLSDFYGASADDGIFNITVGYDATADTYGFATSIGSASPTHKKGVGLVQCLMDDTDDWIYFSLKGRPAVAQDWDQLILNNIPSVGTLTFTRTSLPAPTSSSSGTTWVIPYAGNTWNTVGQNVSIEVTGMPDFTTYGFVEMKSDTTDLPWLQGAIGYVRGLMGLLAHNFETLWINNEEYIINSSYTKDGNYQLSIDWGDTGSTPLVKADISNVIVQQMFGFAPSYPLGVERMYNPASASYTVSGDTGSWVWPSQETLNEDRYHTVEIN